MSDDEDHISDAADSITGSESGLSAEDLERINITARVAEISDRRAVIEQVKGMLCLVYGVSAEQAFNLLKWRSQATNTKLRALAEQLFIDFRASRLDGQLPSQATLDGIFMNAHHRVSSLVEDS